MSNYIAIIRYTRHDFVVSYLDQDSQA